MGFSAIEDPPPLNMKITKDDAFCALNDFSMVSAARIDSSFGVGCPPRK
jgi:hypothetical protein